MLHPSPLAPVRRLQRPLACLVVLSALAVKAHGTPPVYENPLIEQRADPHITLHDDGYYYFIATVPEYDRIELRRARRIEDLPSAEPEVIWRKHERGAMGAHIWAPELHHIDGKWYIYFAAGDAERVWNIRMYALVNASPNPLTGAWEEAGEIETRWDSFSLDATTFELRGERYLVWAQNDPNGPRGTDLYLAKMASPTRIVPPQVRISTAELPWETIGHRVNEGAAVLHRNGRVFMAYSASATDANYCIGLLTMDENDDPLDPASWRKSPRPVFESGNGVYGPGHNSFTTTPDGEHDLLVYHARDYREIEGEPLYDPNRHTRVQVLEWNARGEPDFGEPRPARAAPAR